MFSRATIYEFTLHWKKSGTTLPYGTQLLCWPPEQWMPNALLFGACDVCSTLPQRHFDFLLVMWRCGHPDETLMGGKRG